MGHVKVRCTLAHEDISQLTPSVVFNRTPTQSNETADPQYSLQALPSANAMTWYRHTHTSPACHSEFGRARRQPRKPLHNDAAPPRQYPHNIWIAGRVHQPLAVDVRARKPLEDCSGDAGGRLAQHATALMHKEPEPTGNNNNSACD